MKSPTVDNTESLDKQRDKHGAIRGNLHLWCASDEWCTMPTYFCNCQIDQYRGIEYGKRKRDALLVDYQMLEVTIPSGDVNCMPH